MTTLSVISENLMSGAIREPRVGWGGAFLEEVELVTYYMCLQVKKQKGLETVGTGGFILSVHS